VLTAGAGTVVDATTDAAVSGAVTSLQWLRGSKPIPGATKARYTLVRADRGHRITVRETVTATGYVPFSDTATATRAVAKR
jgi:hypothetical protein